MKDAVHKINTIFKRIDPNVALTVEQLDDDSVTLYGPYPSFMMMLNRNGPARVIIHVNADAPNMVYVMNAFSAEIDLVFDGAFAINTETGQLLFDQEAYDQKSDNIIALAKVALTRKKQEAAEKESKIYVPGSSKIILG